MGPTLRTYVHLVRLTTRLLALLGLLAVPVLLALASEHLAARPDAPPIPDRGIVRLDGVAGDTAPSDGGTSTPAPAIPTQITRSAQPAPPPGARSGAATDTGVDDGDDRADGADGDNRDDDGADDD